MLNESIQKAVQFLLNAQRPDGHWVCELEGDTILESEYIIMEWFLENRNNPKLKKAAEYIRRKQLPSGGWAIYEGGPPELSASVKAYFVLKLTGTSPDEPHMKRAREEILRMGGADECNSYTKFYLAALGQISWDVPPFVPPEIILFPKWSYINLYEVSSWSRTFIVPLSIICSYKPVVSVPPELGIRELFLSNKRKKKAGILTWKKFFFTVDRILKFVDKHNIHPWRKKALQLAEKWMLEHFEKSAGLGAIFPPMVYALMTLRCLGYPDDHPQVVRARRELEELIIEEEDTLRLQPCKSPVWDTAIAMNALGWAGLPPNSPEMIKAAEWILSEEIRSPGDWCVKRPNVEPGGWCFEYANEFYPDIDDTAMVLLGLKRASINDRTDAAEAKKRAINWIMAMQGKDGGWASFDVDNNHQILCNIPFADHNAMIDPSTADITARILEMLAAYGYDQSHPQVKRAINYLIREQEPDGSWFGRWGVNYIYGTWQVLRGLTAIGLPIEHQSIRGGVRWLLQCQNSDGGWGETCLTYDKPSEKGRGTSTASQTAWAVMGLMSAGHLNSPAVERGIEFLIRTQTEEGTWEEKQWTGTGFPRVFYLRYHMYRHAFPLWALGMYAWYKKSSAVKPEDETSGRAVV